MEKSCSRCNQTKTFDKFIKNRNICKQCDNMRKQQKYQNAKTEVVSNKTCNICTQTKLSISFMTNRPTCRDCHNAKRQHKYQTNEDHRLELIKTVTLYKHNKVIERRAAKLEEIGENNKKCSCCDAIKPKENFRYNRLKCRHCERDDPVDKFKRSVRSRIYIALQQNKEKHTIEYLGTSSSEYLQWIASYDDKCNLANRGKDWHIDHVIPLSRFNLDDEAEQLIAFNWRNTMPLSVKENLSKNNKILPHQIEHHLVHLSEYHTKYKIEMPQVYIDLFAKYLVAGIPLEPSLPLCQGNLVEELG